ISASISTTTLSLVITFCRGNTYTVSRKSILSVRKWRANESPAGVTITWCQSIARGRSMSGMIRLTPEERVRWYFPSRSMIMVCACCTMRIPRATMEIANSTIAAGTISAPMLSIRSRLLIHVQGRALYSDDHDPGAGLERHVHERGRAPVLALDYHPPLAGSRVDALRHDPEFPRERVHVGLDLAASRMQAAQQEGPDTQEGEQRAGRERQRRRERSWQHERHEPRRQGAHRHRQEPKPGRDHLGHEQEQGGDEPHLPLVHDESLRSRDKHPKLSRPRGPR